MKKSLAVISLSFCLSAHALADGVFANESHEIPQVNNPLTGDKRLACEAILCLSSGNRPSECNPSLKRYFSINHKHLSDTLKARRNFLSMCPSSNEQGMPELINTIANGAGRCDAKTLNHNGFYLRNRGSRRFVINPNKPSYCTAYENHKWTRIETTKLEPIYCNDGFRWSNSRKYQCSQKWVNVPVKD